MIKEKNDNIEIKQIMNKYILPLQASGEYSYYGKNNVSAKALVNAIFCAYESKHYEYMIEYLFQASVDSFCSYAFNMSSVKMYWVENIAAGHPGALKFDELLEALQKLFPDNKKLQIVAIFHCFAEDGVIGIYSLDEAMKILLEIIKEKPQAIICYHLLLSILLKNDFSQNRSSEFYKNTTKKIESLLMKAVEKYPDCKKMPYAEEEIDDVKIISPFVALMQIYIKLEDDQSVIRIGKYLIENCSDITCDEYGKLLFESYAKRGQWRQAFKIYNRLIESFGKKLEQGGSIDFRDSDAVSSDVFLNMSLNEFCLFIKSVFNKEEIVIEELVTDIDEENFQKLKNKHPWWQDLSNNKGLSFVSGSINRQAKFFIGTFRECPKDTNLTKFYNELGKELFTLRIKDELIKIINSITLNMNAIKTVKYLAVQSIKELLQGKIKVEQEVKEQEKITKGRLAEREKVIADLSHNVKNLLASSVIDPLNWLKNSSSTDDISTIENALKGADLIRRVINAVNLSYSGTADDFIYDAENPGNNPTGLKQTILDSLYLAFGNMFDGFNFGKFQKGYFLEGKTRKEYTQLLIEAKTALQNLNRNSLEEFIDYAKKYLFNLHIELDGVEEYFIGDTKGSAMKLLILFQEIILNAVKYSSFVDGQLRTLHITIKAVDENIAIEVINSFSPEVKAKSTGIGHHIVANMAKIMSGNYKIEKNKTNYSVQLTIPNFWSNIPQENMIYLSGDRPLAKASEQHSPYNKSE